MDISLKIAEELGIKKTQVDAAVGLIDEGNTIPFIARYRKEVTGSLNDEQLRSLHERLVYLRNLEEKKASYIASIDEQGKLTDELRAKIEAAEKLVTLEDLYRPYKQKKKTRALAVKARGLEPLADFIQAQNATSSVEDEAATKDGLSEITTTKDYNKDILKRLDWMNQISKRNPQFAKSGHTTQLIVGANDETDLEILKRMESLYKKVDLRRSYFSAFSPVEGTEFEKREGCNTDRTAKLYHADALLSDYKFDVRELVFDDNDKLFLNEDPKILAAREMDIFPVEINYAPYKQLIRVPGIGPKSAKKIMTIRKNKPFTKLEELKILGVVVKRAEPYIKLDGNYQTALDNY